VGFSESNSKQLLIDPFNQDYGLDGARWNLNQNGFRFFLSQMIYFKITF